MSRSVRLRYDNKQPGGGFDSSGGAKQGKAEVRGVIVVDSYEKGGESLSAAELGLTNIDYISLSHTEELSGNDPGQGLRRVVYSTSAGEFYILDGDQTEAEGATTHNVYFNAIGDTIRAPDLT